MVEKTRAVTEPEPKGVDSWKLCLAQLQYTIDVSTNFQYNNSKTVGGALTTQTY